MNSETCEPAPSRETKEPLSHETKDSAPSLERKFSESMASVADSQQSEVEGKCSFTCGNPDAQTIHGIMHFFNDFSKCKSIFQLL